MLQIQNIKKQYKTGELVQTALDGISLNLRDNEFVAILGPSGSGKTTLLNVIGGLDRYDSGDLIINGISTKKYQDKDWDSYRNHTIGFVFQSYNLIPHQSVLANVELALTISGVSRSERRKRSVQALAEVGLKEQMHKRPNQMSGGQMQRVAIARALVNDPDILLADEPTGALDSDTSVQVMELLKKVAKDRLVVMVTHNPELAETYANRIVKVRDGKIIDDTNPYAIDATELCEPKHQTMGRSSMSFRTSLSLSFNNLKTKKGRTLLTSFAGSIGIIGIALILSLSNGVNDYIADIQKSTMTSYPIMIEERSIDLSSMMETGKTAHTSNIDHGLDGIYANGREMEMVSSMTSSIMENNLSDFKKYLDDPASEIHQYVGENGIQYSYHTKFSVFTYDPEGTLVNTDGSSLSDQKSSSMQMSQMSGASSSFDELLPGEDPSSISIAITDNYDVVYGAWPAAYDEIILVLDENHEISSRTLYQLGILPVNEYKELMDQINRGEEISLADHQWSYEELSQKVYYLIPDCNLYQENEHGTFTQIKDDPAELKKAVERAVPLKITGVVTPKEDAANTLITGNIGYTKALTNYLIDVAEDSAVVNAQKQQPDTNVLNGMSFAPADDAAKLADTKTYLANLGVSEKAKLCKELMQSQASAQIEQMSEEQLAAALDTYLRNPDDKALLGIYDTYISTGNYDENMEAFGVVSLDAPSSISIYADSFEAKESISDSITQYNTTVSEENQITYTDYVALLMSSVTTIVNVISYVLIAFVGVSLIVSSIMIGIITYISVLERTKEIGILRAIGASKKNVAQVFNAETFIIGICSGTIGVIICLLLLIPGNAIIHTVTGSSEVNASLPVISGLILIVLSMGLTMLGGLIPSKKAAKKDPVTALRTE